MARCPRLRHSKPSLTVSRALSSSPSLATSLHPHRRYATTTTTTNNNNNNNRTHDPLRILFCGSDEFSAASLHKLQEEHLQHPDRIASIDVVCRPGKRTGRGLKVVREVPIKSIAMALGLRLHEVDTFTGWEPPSPMNLIIAVSFGLFVPPRILQSAKYGGLNVHPSLLPDLRGPAPLHHALLQARTHTGLTLQTLHPQHFDRGQILLQTPAPGLAIPKGGSCSVDELRDFLAPKGADLLLQGLRDAVFVPSPVAAAAGHHQQSKEEEEEEEDRGGAGGHARRAPKITPEDRHVDWRTWTAATILRRERVLGPLWGMARLEDDAADANAAVARRDTGTGLDTTEPSPAPPPPTPTLKRVIMQGFNPVPHSSSSFLPSSCAPPYPYPPPGTPFLRDDGAEPSTPPRLGVFTCDGTLLDIDRIKVESRQVMEAARAARKERLLAPRHCGGSVHDGRDVHVWMFRQELR